MLIIPIHEIKSFQNRLDIRDAARWIALATVLERAQFFLKNFTIFELFPGLPARHRRKHKLIFPLRSRAWLLWGSSRKVSLRFK
ncbi:hypothetical protein [Treponema pallidum]|uniref:hypothetical protein n=1 Tax=Treponema pallidum TaxID=160 RepID=UPI0020CA5C2F|nr:hypothetical protein [Treponema pallidum]